MGYRIRIPGVVAAHPRPSREWTAGRDPPAPHDPDGHPLAVDEPTLRGKCDMLLRTKVILLYALSAVTVTGVLGSVLYNRLWQDRLTAIREDLSSQLQHIEFALTTLFTELDGDLNNLVANDIVRTRQDRHFTHFLHADEKTFRYNIRPPERAIIKIFNTYRLTHPHVNSVYMGRENGAFVRSHKRERPTRYDPRERPWYLLAKAHPDRVMHTDAYPSVTTSDVNIGIVRALVDERGVLYGVVGIDVTLAGITDYLSHFKIDPPGRLFLTDARGVVLASDDRNLHFKNIRQYSPELFRLLTTHGEGAAVLDVGNRKTYAHYRPIAGRGLKIAVLIPAANIEAEIRRPVVLTVVGLAFGFTLMALTALIGFQILVTRPLRRFVEETNYIAETSNLDRRIDIHSRDEIGRLANSYNEMIGTLERARESLIRSEQDLREHRDRLEELVRERTGHLLELNEKLSREIDIGRRREEELQRVLTDLAEAKERAEAADRLKSAFLATMSHELRTPLNSIIGFTGIILRERVGSLNDEQKKQLTMVLNSARHLLALINDVLDISKIEAGQLQVAQETIDLRPIIEKAVQSARPLADQNGLDLECEIPTDIGTVTGDARRIEQVVLNLLGNAIKFTPEGSVRIRCASEPDRVVVRVEDTGIGIKPEDIETIFEAFRQADTGLKRKYEGTGLGLSISRRLVELMGGRIWATSALGTGSTFSFSLPKGGGRHEAGDPGH